MTNPLQLLKLDEHPHDTLPYLNAGGKGRVEQVMLPILRAKVDVLPHGLSAIVFASDLQGREVPDGDHPPRLLGEALADHLVGLAEAGLFPDPKGVGVVLAGDLYTVPGLTKRGGLGDVSAVWRAFDREFRWVVGVAGNHDSFGTDAGAFERFQRRGPGHLLDGDTVELDGVLFGGVSGIVGNPRKTNRKFEEDYLSAVGQLLDRRVDVLVLHESPKVAEHGLRGRAAVREILETAEGPLLVVCGHCHWRQPIVEIGDGVQVVNVDARVVVLSAGDD